MGMSTHIIGFRPPDAKWKQMKTIWDSCKSAGVEPPPEVHQFFGYDEPDESGITVILDELDDDAVKEYSADMADGYEIDLEAFRTHHPHITKIRFYNSW